MPRTRHWNFNDKWVKIPIDLKHIEVNDIIYHKDGWIGIAASVISLNMNEIQVDWIDSPAPPTTTFSSIKNIIRII